MKSEYQIYMDFRRANQVAEDLRAIARNTRDAADQDLQSALSRIQSNWEGENADAFQTKGTRLKQQVDQLAKDVDRIANAIETIAQNTYNAEMRAVQIAQTSGGSGGGGGGSW
jgi:WXG100 family type VII secretion target